MKYTLLVYVLMFNGQFVQVEGFNSLEDCNKGAASVRELIIPRKSGIDASQYLRHVCVPVR